MAKNLSRADNNEMKDTRIKDVGFNIKVERLRQNLTQEDLSEMSNVSVESIQKIEAGKQTPSVFIFFDIQKALKVSVKTLYKDFEDFQQQ